MPQRRVEGHDVFLDGTVRRRSMRSMEPEWGSGLRTPRSLALRFHASRHTQPPCGEPARPCASGPVDAPGRARAGRSGLGNPVQLVPAGAPPGDPAWPPRRHCFRPAPNITELGFRRVGGGLDGVRGVPSPRRPGRVGRDLAPFCADGDLSESHRIGRDRDGIVPARFDAAVEAVRHVRLQGSVLAAARAPGRIARTAGGS
jgi:hypothetical protein